VFALPAGGRQHPPRMISPRSAASNMPRLGSPYLIGMTRVPHSGQRSCSGNSGVTVASGGDSFTHPSWLNALARLMWIPICGPLPVGRALDGLLLQPQGSDQQK
jgi:hypothetical protein